MQAQTKKSIIRIALKCVCVCNLFAFRLSLVYKTFKEQAFCTVSNCFAGVQTASLLCLMCNLLVMQTLWQSVHCTLYNIQISIINTLDGVYNHQVKPSVTQPLPLKSDLECSAFVNIVSISLQLAISFITSFFQANRCIFYYLIKLKQKF